MAYDKILINGEKLTLAEICRRFNKSYHQINHRLRRGESIAEALELVPRFRPPRKQRKKKPRPPKPIPPAKVTDAHGYTRGGRNFVAAMAAELTGEEYLQREGRAPPQPGHELPLLSPEEEPDSES